MFSFVSDFFYVVVCVLIEVREKKKIRDTTFGPWRWRRTVAWRRFGRPGGGTRDALNLCFLVSLFLPFRFCDELLKTFALISFPLLSTCFSSDEMLASYACMLRMLA